eukprot:13240102-Heterocapsa_arctica.AAC.1
MGEHHRDEDGDYGSPNGAGRARRNVRPLQQPRGLSEPQEGSVWDGRQVPHVQGILGRAPDEYGLQSRAHNGHDAMDQDYAEEPGVEVCGDREEVHHGVHTSID